MNHDNPYTASALAHSDSVDPEGLHAVAARLAAARSTPPTVIGSLSQWRGTQMTMLVGVVGTAVLMYLANLPRLGVTAHFSIGLAAMVFGAVLRDIGLARRIKRTWPAQSHFIDWDKVDEFSQ
jgi:hypothetical protein